MNDADGAVLSSRMKQMRPGYDGDPRLAQFRAQGCELPHTNQALGGLEVRPAVRCSGPTSVISQGTASLCPRDLSRDTWDRDVEFAGALWEPTPSFPVAVKRSLSE